MGWPVGCSVRPMVPVEFGRTSALAEEHVGVDEGGGRALYSACR